MELSDFLTEMTWISRSEGTLVSQVMMILVSPGASSGDRIAVFGLETHSKSEYELQETVISNSEVMNPVASITTV